MKTPISSTWASHEEKQRRSSSAVHWVQLSVLGGPGERPHRLQGAAAAVAAGCAQGGGGGMARLAPTCDPFWQGVSTQVMK